MLEEIDLNKSLDRKEYKKFIKHASVKLAFLQRKCRELNLPIVIMMEGLDASGKGTQINQLITPLDPRGFDVIATKSKISNKDFYKFMKNIWRSLPPKGKIHIYDQSWYHRFYEERFIHEKLEYSLNERINEIMQVEEQLAADGMIFIKFFLHISKKEQTRRLKKLESKKETAWRVNKKDWKKNKEYNRHISILEQMLEDTDTKYSPWTIIEAEDKAYATAKILSTVIEQLSIVVKNRLAQIKNKVSTLNGEKDFDKFTKENDDIDAVDRFRTGILKQYDLNQSYQKEEYRKRLKVLQGRLSYLQNELSKKNIPLVIAFEGWDAAGKGGAIKRVTQRIDPRRYEVNPISAPNDIEKSYHYLWRFWNKFPDPGHIAIFDRTWYGRVLVERVEGFCSRMEWKRAYSEINDMERQLREKGCIILKFWLHIDKEEQKKRFEARQNSPEKQWKITEEDWRNREKWELYEEAVDEMVLHTSTRECPWTIVEANSKYFARLKVLETIIEKIEETIKK